MYETIAPNHDEFTSVFGITETKLENGNTKWNFTPTGYWKSYTAGEKLEVELKGEDVEALAVQMSEMENILVNTSRQKEIILVAEGADSVFIRTKTSHPVEVNLKDKFETAVKEELDVAFEDCRIVSFFSFTEETLKGKVTATEGNKMLVDDYCTSENFVISNTIVEVDGMLMTLSTVIYSPTFHK